MRHRNGGRTLAAVATVLTVVLTAVMVRPSDAPAAVGIAADNPCLAAPEDINHANIRLDEPAEGTQLAVDEHGQIAVSGVLHKQAAMTDVTAGAQVTTAFTYGPPPAGTSAWAASWNTHVRPSHLGSIELCARAWRDPKWSARVLRNITVVDLIPPSNVPGLSSGSITSNSAKVTWGAATDNYGLAGYEVTVDGGTAVRTTINTRSYAITGLLPSTVHTVSVVAVDLAGNKSPAPAAVSFTTLAPPPPPNPDTDLVVKPEEGSAVATWHPSPATDATYSAFLDGALVEDFAFDQYCQDAAGNPASPCTAQDVIGYPITGLDQGTPYMVQIRASAADGTQSRMLTSTFTTTTTPPVVPEATVAQISTESSRCAGMGGDFYTSASVRGRVSIPAGSTQLFDGCYKAANTSCLDAFLPPSGSKIIKCADDITRLLHSVAPPGGPVISSVSAATSLVPSPVMEPINWCVEEPIECVEIIGEAGEVVAVVAEAATASAVASFLVVAAEGIGLGLALGVLWAVLFPTELTIGSLFEYTLITPDTDFDTFTKWGGDNGEWINSLKMYAEVIKTTKLLAEQHNLPLAWDIFKSQNLKATIDSACAVQQGHTAPPARPCGDDVVVYVPGAKNFKFDAMPETGQHIVDAMTTGQANDPRRALWYYPAYSPSGKLASGPPNNYPRTWYYTAPFKPNACDPHVKGDGKTCDEFPFFTTNQAVDLTLPDKSLRADVRLTPTSEGSFQGNDLSTFYRQCLDNTDGKRFIVLPVPSWIAAGGPSFGFQVNQGGADVCMQPQPRATTP
jgi:hypothetical protein